MSQQLDNIQKLAFKISSCRLCNLSHTRIHALPGEGNVNATIMFIAQAPGRQEDKEGRMFIGPSGQVLDTLFEGIGLKRSSVYMTNLVKCFLPNCRKPRQEEIDTCSVYLKNELEMVSPKLIIPLGYHPVKNILRLYEKHIPNRHHFPGLFGRLLVAGDKQILPLRHPATVVHDRTNFDILERNYRKIKVVTQTCKWFDLCPVKTFYDQGMLTKEWIDLYCKGDWESCLRYQKEELLLDHPDNMLPNGEIDPNLSISAG